MAVTFTPDTSGASGSPIAVAGGVWLLFGVLDFSGSYVTGGDDLDLEKFLPQMSTLRQVVALGTVRGHGVEFDVTNAKLKLFTSDPTSNAVEEHSAAAYDSDLTGSDIPVAFLCK